MRYVTKTVFISVQLHGSASDYCALSLRAISQKSLSYFIENRDMIVDHKFGTVSANGKKSLKEHCFQKEPYFGMASLVNHNEDEEKYVVLQYLSFLLLLIDSYLSSAVESLWVVASACFTLRRLQLAGFFGDKIRRRCHDFSSDLTEEERTVARAAANFLRIMRYNTHSVEETVS